MKIMANKYISNNIGSHTVNFLDHVLCPGVYHRLEIIFGNIRIMRELRMLYVGNIQHTHLSHYSNIAENYLQPVIYTWAENVIKKIYSMGINIVRNEFISHYLENKMNIN